MKEDAMLTLSLFAVFLLMAGCIGGEAQETTNVTENITKPQPVVELPSFTIVAPDDDEVFLTSEGVSAVEVVLSTKNLVIREGGAKKIGEGHFLVTLDESERFSEYKKVFTLENVGEGEHVLRIELVHNDGSSYTPKISRSVRFYVRKVITEYTPVEHVIKIKDFSYEPATATVNVGDTVTWVNEGGYPRSATCLPLFDTGVISPGKNASIVMREPGECDYFDLSFPTMKARIKINKVD
ncbi:MAG: hypothetical protein QXT05_02165 [Candidatus Bilamarchaeaceae archaeon]